MEKILHKKTLKMPIHFETNKKKITKLDKITVRLTYAIRSWNRIIEKKI